MKAKNCDDAFAEYLVHLAECVNADFYTTALIFVLLYRDSLNEYGICLLER